jgi:phage-related tail protein
LATEHGLSVSLTLTGLFDLGVSQYKLQDRRLSYQNISLADYMEMTEIANIIEITGSSINRVSNSVSGVSQSFYKQSNSSLDFCSFQLV